MRLHLPTHRDSITQATTHPVALTSFPKRSLGVIVSSNSHCNLISIYSIFPAMVPLRWSLKQLGLATSATMWTWLVGASFEYTMATQRKTIKLRIRLEFTLTSVCVCVFVSATSDRFSPVWRFRPYKPYIFWKLIIWWWPRPRQRHAKRRKTDTDKDKKCASNIQHMLYFYRVG